MCPEIQDFCILEKVDCRMELVSDVEELPVQVLEPIVEVLVSIKEPFGKVLAQLVLMIFGENSSRVKDSNELVQCMDALQHRAMDVMVFIQHLSEHLQAREQVLGLSSLCFQARI